MSYIDRVVDQFLEHHSPRGALGAADYTMIAEWEKREIPLSIVLNALSESGRHCSADDQEGVSVTRLQEQIEKDYIASLQAARGEP